MGIFVAKSAKPAIIYGIYRYDKVKDKTKEAILIKSLPDTIIGEAKIDTIIRI